MFQAQFSSSYIHFLKVYSDKEPITLMNLEPSTRYRVRVQLSRPGEGGEGAPGPEAIMETDCPGKSHRLLGHLVHRDHCLTADECVHLEILPGNKCLYCGCLDCTHHFC